MVLSKITSKTPVIPSTRSLSLIKGEETAEYVHIQWQIEIQFRIDATVIAV